MVGRAAMIRIDCTPRTLATQWASYAIYWEASGAKPFYVGACPLSEITKLPDARLNSEFAKHIGLSHMITVAILGTHLSETDARNMVDVTVSIDRPHCNIVGEQREHRTAKAVRLKRTETNIIYETMTEAAASVGVTRQALSEALRNGGGRYARIRGAIFERL